MSRRYALRDGQWDRIQDLLPGRVGWVGVTAKDNRKFVEAVLYRYRAGIAWRDLPERFGEWKQIHTALVAVGGQWRVGGGVYRLEPGCRQRIFHDRLHHRAGASAQRGGA